MQLLFAAKVLIAALRRHKIVALAVFLTVLGASGTPLELASEMGIPLTVVVAVAWIFALVVLSLGLRGRRRDMTVLLPALAVSLIALLHSSFDFSLQIAGYSIVVFA